MNHKSNLLLTITLFGLASTAQATMIADGDLKDWLHAPVGNANDWKSVINPNVKYAYEDQTGGANTYLTPGYGGQAYDAEAIYLTQDATNFYVAVVTGLSPSTTSYPAGDLAFDFGNNGVYEYGVIVKSDSQTNNQYNGGMGTQGQVYKVNQWNVGLWDSATTYVGFNNGTLEHPATVKSGSLLGLAQLTYGAALYNGAVIAQLGEYSGAHYVIEAVIAKSLFTPGDLAQAFTVHWTMACANDSISVDPPALSVPAPAALPLLSLGLLMLVRRVRAGSLAV